MTKTEAFDAGFDAGVKSTEKENKCHAPVASPEGKSSSGIGNPLLNGPLDSVDLTQLQQNSEAIFMMSKALEYQTKKIESLEQGIKFLAEQVKTLVDALAEEQEDPERPITNYMSGRPV